MLEGAADALLELAVREGTPTTTNGLESKNGIFYLTQAPAITSASSAVFFVGEAGSFTVTVTGIPTPTITVSGALPTGVTFTDNGNRTATLAGTPISGTAGLYSLTFTASNGAPPNATQNFRLLVAKARVYLPLVLPAVSAYPNNCSPLWAGTRPYATGFSDRL